MTEHPDLARTYTRTIAFYYIAQEMDYLDFQLGNLAHQSCQLPDRPQI